MKAVELVFVCWLIRGKLCKVLLEESVIGSSSVHYGGLCKSPSIGLKYLNTRNKAKRP